METRKVKVGYKFGRKRTIKKNMPQKTNRKITLVPIKDLIASEYNPRKSTQKQIEDLKESIKRFGLVDPIIVNSAPNRKNVIIGGHFRVRVAKEMGIKEVPVVYVNIPDIKKEQELNLRLNKNLGEWDWDLLANIEEDLLQEVGFESEELDRIFDLDIQEDDFNAEQEYKKIKKPKTKLGDLYQLGNHRLLCGDATKKEDVEKLMGGEKADMVFTDPPYNMDYKGRKFDRIKGDSQTEEEFVDFSIKFIKRMSEALKSGGVFYICSGYSSYPIFLYAIKKNGLIFSTPIVWVKNNTSLGWGDYRHKHEMILKVKNTKKKKAQPILYGWNNGKHYFKDTRFEADVWEIKKRASNKMVHPTQKPLELVGRAIRNSSKRGEIVLDLFGGSGSTLISAEKEGRRCFIQELDPKYCDIIIARWEKFTGKKAKKL